MVSLVLLEACKFPEMCAVPPCSGTWYEQEIGRTRGRGWANLRNMDIRTFNGLSQPLRINNEKKFSELDEGIEGNHV